MDTTPIELLVLDVDGVLTDGSIVQAWDGRSTKAFHAQDGCAIKLWQQCDLGVAILSGRDDEVVTRRASELGIKWVHTGVVNKLDVYEAILTAAGCTDSAVAYVGDDLPDLGPMSRCGFPVAVASAVPTVKRLADYVTRRRGGEGAVAEVVELLLRNRGCWPRHGINEA